MGITTHTLYLCLLLPLPIVSIKIGYNKHTFYSQLPNLNGFERGFRSDFSGKKSHSFFGSIRGRYHGALEGMNG